MDDHDFTRGARHFPDFDVLTGSWRTQIDPVTIRLVDEGVWFGYHRTDDPEYHAGLWWTDSGSRRLLVNTPHGYHARADMRRYFRERGADSGEWAPGIWVVSTLLQHFFERWSNWPFYWECGHHSFVDAEACALLWMRTDRLCSGSGQP